MFLLIGGVMLVISNVLGQKSAPLPPMLPNTYKDIFVPGKGGKKTLGTMQSTCWARGGICVEIRECPSLIMDVSISGCAYGYKVCCKVARPTSPTVGVLRRYDVAVIHDLKELGPSLDIIALRNTMMLSDWQTAIAENEDIRLDDLLN